MFALALALRLLLWSQSPHQPANDEVEYVAVARDLLAGHGWQFYEHYHWLRAPLYPLFLAGSLWLAGGDPASAAALHRAALPNIALSAATVYLNYRLALALFERAPDAAVGGRRGAALLAAALTAVLWTLATFASLYMAETLFTFLFTAALLCLVRWADERRTTKDQGLETTDARERSLVFGLWSLVAAGVLFGLATLTRSVTLMFLPVVAAWLLLRRRTKDEGPRTKDQGRRTNGNISVSPGRWSSSGRSIERPYGRWSYPVIFLLATALTIAPWTIRNYAAYGRVIAVETGLSYNLWAFNEPRETQGTIFRTLEAIPNPAERSDYATARGLERLREDPAILLRKLWPNWVYLWRVKPIEDRFLQESYYGDVGLPLFAAALVFDDALYLMIALAGVAGLALCRGARNEERGTRNEERGTRNEERGTRNEESQVADRESRSAMREAQDETDTHHASRITHHASRITARLAEPRSLVIAWVLYAVVTMLLTHGEARYRQFLFPVLIPYAACALAQTRRQGEGETRRLRACLPLSLSPRLLVLGVLWALIGWAALGHYPWGWAAQNLARGWHASIANIASALGYHEAALRADTRALDVQETADGWIRLGDHALAAGDRERAVRAYREALDDVPAYVPAAARLGNLLRAAGDDAAARRAFAAPKVPQQDLTDWSWRELRPMPQAFLAVGDGLDFGYVNGVYPAEEQQGAAARWTNGRALLRLRAPDGATRALLRLRLAAPRPAGAPVAARVCVAGGCTAIDLGATWRHYSLPIDVSAGAEVEIRSDTFGAPNGRPLGVLVDSAAVVAIE